MSDMSRKEAIENLETLKAFLDVNGVFTVSDAMKKSIDFAIASLETDEAYQLEYERTTKNDLGVDCISRQDVLSEIIRFSTEEGSSVECQQLYCDVNNMPSVTPQEPRWIPVSEKLPEENGGYLITLKGGYVMTALWNGNAEYWSEVTAWMPLPKPYESQESEEWVNFADDLIPIIDEAESEGGK